MLNDLRNAEKNKRITVEKRFAEKSAKPTARSTASESDGEKSSNNGACFAGESSSNLSVHCTVIKEIIVLGRSYQAVLATPY